MNETPKEFHEFIDDVKTFEEWFSEDRFTESEKLPGNHRAIAQIAWEASKVDSRSMKTETPENLAKRAQALLRKALSLIEASKNN